jgi:flagellar assembly protein FliH
VREHRAAIASGSDSIRDMVIEADEKVERGGCILESDSGNVDARISTQLKKIEETLLDKATAS